MYIVLITIELDDLYYLSLSLCDSYYLKIFLYKLCQKLWFCN